MKIGIIAGSMKPIHIGHWKLIELASRECDRVELFVSLNDRSRKNERSVRGSAMQKVWTQHIEHLLPKNVSVTYVTRETPIRAAYDCIDSIIAGGTGDSLVIYGDSTDVVHNFSEKSLQKYFYEAWRRNLIRIEPVPRTSTVNVSGTQMRAWLTSGDFDNFAAHLPPGADSEAIWELLQC